MSDTTGATFDTDPGTGSATSAATDSHASRSRDAEYWESQSRLWQSRHDQAAAERDSLRAQAQAQPTADTEGYDDDDEEDTVLSVAEIQGVIRQEMVRSRVFLSEAEALRSAYPDVAALAPSLFDDATQFDSPEAMRATVETLNHQLEERWAEREAKLRQELGQPRAPVPASPVSTDTEPGAGLPTLEQINQLSASEMERFEAQYPGLIEELTIRAMG